MNIALPSDTGQTVSGHFGHSRSFMVYKTENKEIIKKEIRQNGAVHHHGEEKECGCHGEHHGAEGHHGTILDILKDVDVVIVGGIGGKMYSDLVEAGKIVLMTDETECDAAVKSFLQGSLVRRENGICGCGH